MPKAQPKPPVQDSQVSPAERKIAIVGFTSSNQQAPWGKPGWEIWICNNLWKFCPDKWHRLYDLHNLKTIQEDEEHLAFLSGEKQKHQSGSDVEIGNRPVVTFYPQKEWKTAQLFPKEPIVEKLGRYFTNSISWMIAHALMEGVTELHIYGVDMATGGEYAAQRPSAEFMIGIAIGMGVQVHIPEESDLLKLSAMYGAEDDSALAAKVTSHEADLLKRGEGMQQQLGALQQQVRQGELSLAKIQGALETTRYFKSVWVNPRTTTRHKGEATTATINGETTTEGSNVQPA